MKQKTNDQKIFSQANDLYREKKFSQALTTYKTIEKKTSHVFYNMGNCSYKLGRKGYATLYWRRAELMGGIKNQEDLIENLTFLEKQPFQKPFFSLFTLQASCLMFLLLFFLIFRFLSSRFKRILLFSSLFLFFLSLGATVFQSFQDDKHSIVIAKTELLSGPDLSFHTIRTLKEGSECVPLRKSFGFRMIRIDGAFGWVDGKKIEDI